MLVAKCALAFVVGFIAQPIPETGRSTRHPSEPGPGQATQTPPALNQGDAATHKPGETPSVQKPNQAVEHGQQNDAGTADHPTPQEMGDWLVNLARHQGHLLGRSDPRQASLHVIAILEAAKQVCPDCPDVYYWLFDLMYRMGRTDAAAEALGRYVALKPQDSTARIRYLDMKIDELQTAEDRCAYVKSELAGRALPRPYESELHRRLARHDYEQREIEQAAGEIERSLRLNPMNVPARQLAYEIFGETEPALQRVEMALQLIAISPSQAKLLWDLGEFLDQLSLHRQAQEFYNRAIEVHVRCEKEPVPAAFWYQLAMSCMRSEDYADARHAADEALRIEPSLRLAMLLRAEAAEKSGDRDDARKDMEAVAKAYDSIFEAACGHGTKPEPSIANTTTAGPVEQPASRSNPSEAIRTTAAGPVEQPAPKGSPGEASRTTTASPPAQDQGVTNAEAAAAPSNAPKANRPSDTASSPPARINADQAAEAVAEGRPTRTSVDQAPEAVAEGPDARSPVEAAKPPDAPSRKPSPDEAAETAWFYCYHQPDKDRALAMAKLAMDEPQPSSLARLAYGYALRLNGKTDEARRMLEPMAGSDQMAALALAEIQIEQGQKSQAMTTLHKAATVQYSGVAYKLVCELLDKYGESAAQRPLHSKVVDALDKFHRDVFDYYDRPEDFLKFSMRFDAAELPTVGPIVVVFRLENVGPFPITLGEGYMTKPLVAVSARIGGKDGTPYDNYVQVLLNQTPVLMPGDAIEEPVTTDVGPMHEQLLQSVTQPTEIELTAMLDPIYQDGKLQAGLGTIKAGPIMTIRPAIDVNPAAIAALLDRTNSTDAAARIQAAEEVGAMLAAAEFGASQSKLKNLPVDALSTTLATLLADHDWRVRARAVVAAGWSHLDDRLTNAAAQSVRDPDSPVVKMLAVRLFAQQHGKKFLPVLEQLAKGDPSRCVRLMCRSYLPQQLGAQANRADGQEPDGTP